MSIFSIYELQIGKLNEGATNLSAEDLRSALKKDLHTIRKIWESDRIIYPGTFSDERKAGALEFIKEIRGFLGRQDLNFDMVLEILPRLKLFICFANAYKFMNFPYLVKEIATISRDRKLELLVTQRELAIQIAGAYAKAYGLDFDNGWPKGRKPNLNEKQQFLEQFGPLFDRFWRRIDPDIALKPGEEKVFHNDEMDGQTVIKKLNAEVECLIKAADEIVERLVDKI